MNTTLVSDTTLSLRACSTVMEGIASLLLDFQLTMARPKTACSMANAQFWLGRVCGEAEYIGWKVTDDPAVGHAALSPVEISLRHCVKAFNEAVQCQDTDTKEFTKRCKECRTIALAVEQQLRGMVDGIYFALYHKPKPMNYVEEFTIEAVAQD